MSTTRQSIVNDALEAVSRLLPSNSQQMREDLEKNIRAVLEAKLREMDVVSKEEFNANRQLLQRLKERVTQLEQELEVLASK